MSAGGYNTWRIIESVSFRHNNEAVIWCHHVDDRTVGKKGSLRTYHAYLMLN